MQNLGNNVSVNVENVIRDIVEDHVEFNRLKAFFSDYLYEKYNISIVLWDIGWAVKSWAETKTPNKPLYRHHSYSNCVEWVFNNATLDKE